LFECQKKQSPPPWIWPTSLTILPYSVSYKLVKGASQVQLFLCNEPIWLDHRKKNWNYVGSLKYGELNLFFSLRYGNFCPFFAKKNSFGQSPIPLFLGQQVAKFRPEEKTPPTLPEKAHYSISLVLKNIHLAMSAWRNPRWGLGVGISTLVREPTLVTTNWLKICLSLGKDGILHFQLLCWKWPPRIT